MGGLMELGILAYFIALIPPIAVTVLFFLKRRKKTLYIFGADILIWILTFTCLNNIFPLRIGMSYLESQKWLLCGFIYTPFVHFWDDAGGFNLLVTLIFEHFYLSMIMGLGFGFFATLIFKSARKIRMSFVYIVCILVLTEGSLVLPTFISGVINRYWHTEAPILTFVFYMAGFGLAKAVLRLTPITGKIFDGERKEEVVPQKLNLVKSEDRLKRSNKFEDI